jgi:hypothetical protein
LSSRSPPLSPKPLPWPNCPNPRSRNTRTSRILDQPEWYLPKKPRWIKPGVERTTIAGWRRNDKRAPDIRLPGFRSRKGISRKALEAHQGNSLVWPRS